MAVSQIFQDRFKELVDISGLKKKTEAASEIGLTYATFVKIYYYGIFPTVPILIRIADFFNVSIEFLVGNTDDDAVDCSERRSCFGSRLIELTHENKMTVYQLSERLHIHRNNISQWLKCGYIPTIGDLSIVADYFAVSIDYLLGRTDCRE